MKKSVFGKLVLAATVLVVFLYSCANPMMGTNNLGSLGSSKSVLVSDPVPAGAFESPLTAGGGNPERFNSANLGNAGSVFVWKDADNLYVKYVIKSGYAGLISQTHVWVGPNLADFTEESDFAPGSFPYTANYSPAVNAALVTISLSNVQFAPDGSLYILTHAALTNGETAWAGRNYVAVNRWNFYINTNVPTIETPEPPTTTTTVPPTTTTTLPPPEVVYQNISGFVFHDYDADGVKDSGEPGLSGVEVTLSTGAVVTTGANGEYSFTGLLAQGYRVTSGGKTGFFPTEYDNPVTSRTVTASASNVNFGLSYESISGHVFNDKVGGGIDGVTMTLSGSANVTVATSGGGLYTFDHLKGGSALYAVSVGNVANEFPLPYDNPVVTQSGLNASAANVDFHFSHESISGFAFRDLNANGVMGSSDYGIANVSVTLSGGKNASATTLADGSYLFDYLKGGTTGYTVNVGNVSGEFHTPYLAPVTSWNGGASATDVNFGFSHETVTGVVFYDANQNDVYNVGEPLLQGFAVRLNNGPAVYSDVNGAYTFDNLMGSTVYTVSADDKTGFVHSVASSRTVTPANSQPAVANFGFAVDYSALLGKTANGFTIGYWKTNIDKAISGKTNGIQVPAATLRTYVANLGSFQLFPLNVASLNEASAILSKTSSLPKDLLAKQLMGSELNYQNGAFIGGNALVTYFFLYDGEYMLANPGSFTSTQLLAQKDRYDAYNNTHGGALFF